MTKITDINGAALQQLRSIKKKQVIEQFSSKLRDNKLKQLSEEIVSLLLSTIKGSDDYNIQMYSKMSDVVLGRIASLKATSDITQKDLVALKDDVLQQVSKAGLSDNAKQQLQVAVSAAINSVQPSNNADDVIKEIKSLEEQVNQQTEDNKAAAEKPSDDEISKQIDVDTSEIDKIKDEINQKVSGFTKISSSIKNIIIKHFDELSGKVSIVEDKIFNAISKNVEMTAGKLDTVAQNIDTEAMNSISDFSKLETTTLSGITSTNDQVQSSMKSFDDNLNNTTQADTKNVIKQLDGINILNMFGKSKKKKKAEAILNEFLDLVEPILANPAQFFLDALTKNLKKIQKVLKKLVNLILLELEVAVLKVVDKILGKIMAMIVRLLAVFVVLVVSALMLPLKIPLMMIAASLGLIVAAIFMALMKFPEMVAPIVESIKKFALLIVKTVQWLITEVWSFVSGQLWPFLKDEVWGFVTNELWTFVTERIFPIIERVYKWVWEEFWPFLCNEFYPWLLEQVGKFFTFIEKEFWPFILDTLTWFKDTIITPVWEKFVLPVLSWIVEKVMPWIAEHVAPVIKTILEVLNEFLQALAPWIKPLFGKMLKIIDWILKLLQKVFKILEPGIMAVVKCIKNLFVGVFNLIKDMVIGVVEFIELLIKAFKQAWNQLCDYFADVCIDITTPKSWVWPLDGVHILGPYYPFKSMRAMKFDIGSAPSGQPSSPQSPAELEADAVDGSDKEALERLNNYIDGAYGKIFHYLKILAKLLGIDTSDSPALKQLGSAGVFSGTKALRGIDASKKLDKYSDDPISKISKIINNISSFLDSNISPAITNLMKATGHEDLVITVKADEVAKDKAKEVEGNNVDEESKAGGFDPNEFLDELLKDDTDEELKTDEDNAFSFLANNVFPYMNDNIRPLIMHIRELAAGINPSNNSVVNIIGDDQKEDEMNYALVDQ